jgi:hypothetical protein
MFSTNKNVYIDVFISIVLDVHVIISRREMNTWSPAKKFLIESVSEHEITLKSNKNVLW